MKYTLRVSNQANLPADFVEELKSSVDVIVKHSGLEFATSAIFELSPDEFLLISAGLLDEEGRGTVNVHHVVKKKEDA